jgi:predicted RNase H-like nuclease (RuvC/YqgF family)
MKDIVSLKIVDEENGNRHFEVSFEKASATELLQLFAYSIDVAVKENKEDAQTLAGMLPDVMHKYIELKESQSEVSEQEAKVKAIEEEIKALEAKLEALKGEDVS